LPIITPETHFCGVANVTTSQHGKPCPFDLDTQGVLVVLQLRMAPSGGAAAPPLNTFAWLFDEPTHADVRLHVRHEGDQSDAAEVAQQHARSYYAHAVVLASQSDYFKVGGQAFSA
jgi:hypothetical protein